MLCFCSGQGDTSSLHLLSDEFRVDRWWKIFLRQITSFTWAVVGWARWNDMPWNRVVNVAVFQGPNMFAKFDRVPMLCVMAWCNVVSVSCLEVIFCKAYVCFWSVSVVTCKWSIFFSITTIFVNNFVLMNEKRTTLWVKWKHRKSITIQWVMIGDFWCIKFQDQCPGQQTMVCWWKASKVSNTVSLGLWWSWPCWEIMRV